MALKTLAEQFAPLIAGRYTGSPGLLWQQLGLSWNAESVVDVTTEVEFAPDHTHALSDEILDALGRRDFQKMLVLVDLAEEKGVSSELCSLTRQALRVQYAS